MACCVLKSVCGCIDLKNGSTILGYIVLVLKSIWLCLRIADIVILTPYTFSEASHNSIITLGYSLAVMHLMTLILQVIFICIILVGLSKENRPYLEAFKPSAVCYVIECIIFVITIWYARIHWQEVYVVVVFTSDVIVKLSTPFFLLAVRSHYLQTGDPNKTGIVYRASRETAKLHDRAIIITI